MFSIDCSSSAAILEKWFLGFSVSQIYSEDQYPHKHTDKIIDTSCKKGFGVLIGLNYIYSDLKHS